MMPRTAQTSMGSNLQSGGPIYVGGIDPGITQAGYGLVTCGSMSGGCEVLDCGCLKNMTGATMAGVLDRWYRRATAHRGEPVLLLYIGVEGQWVPTIDERLARSPKKLKATMGQINSTVDVAANRGAWIALAEARGWAAEKLHPSQWRRGLNRASSGKRKPLKDAAIEAIKLRERQLFRKLKMPKAIPDHMAEAILIAEYKAKQQQLAALQGGQGVWK
jgi:Holliday junction resolvasome RuvABC endonuclease subunit